MKTHPFYLIAVAAALAGCAGESPQADYHQPLTSPGGEFATVPPAVQNSVRAEAGSAEITSVTKDDRTGSTIYVFTFRDASSYPPLYVATDGRVLRANLTVAVGASIDTIAASTGSGVGGVKMDDLPAGVITTIHKQAPTGEVHSIRRIASGRNIYYEISFQDPAHHPRLLVNDDGRVMR